MFKITIICAAAIAVSPTSFGVGMRDTSIDRLCSTFTEWQKLMKAGGHPSEKYAKTGMEKFCPSMI